MQYAKFESIVLKKFFQDEFDVDAYAESVRILTEKFNESTIENHCSGHTLYGSEELWGYNHRLGRAGIVGQ